MIRLRFGFKNLIWLLPNAGIFIVRADEDKAARLEDGVDQVRMVLRLIGRGEIADKLICERS
jgi:hypothetical protein